MYKKFLLIVLWICPLFLSAQILEPLYKFTLHFEDARGNRDSVVMGFDSLAFPCMIYTHNMCHSTCKISSRGRQLFTVIHLVIPMLQRRL